MTDRQSMGIKNGMVLEMREQLASLRKCMKQHQVDACLIPTGDFHGSEYVGEYFKTREYISGFTGSAGTLLVMEEEAWLWTDGRYFLQASDQLAGTGIGLMKEREPEVPAPEEYLSRHMKAGQTLAFDGRCVMEDRARKLSSLLEPAGVKIRMDLDLAGEVWPDRPSMSCAPAWELDLAYAGESRGSKIARVREAIKGKADYLLLASLTDICWLLNVRGDDVESTPVVLSYLLLGRDSLVWYVQDCLPGDLRERLEKEGIRIRGYDGIYEDLAGLTPGSVLQYNGATVNAALAARVSKEVTVRRSADPTTMMKAVKNPVEVENMRTAHIEDGLAVTRFIYWLKKEVGRGAKITEISAAEKLEELRADSPDYLEPSFAPIIACKDHAAIVHYSATEESDVPLGPEGFVLADTGGHYLTGTTDITRTIALGPLTEEEKEMYTLVLRSHIDLASARFLHGCTGRSLDGLAREPFWERGLDYNHGTGHGVGYLLSVHEGPNAFRYHKTAAPGEECVFEEGMITSDEPGIYLAGKFGVRLENLILCRKDVLGGYGQFLCFEPLTLVPFDRDAILADQLSRKEKNWLNAYQKKVRETLLPRLSAREAEWLMEETRPF